MVNKTYEQCISRILRDIQKQKLVEYGDKASVRRYNSAALRIIDNIKYIVANYPEDIDACIDMMYHPDPDVSLSFACNVISFIPCSNQQKLRAISRVKELSKDERIQGITRAGLPLAIRRWEKQYGK